ncbi:Na-K-Cl cotransporter [candidate division FCPU426 bacterium]|nr:Na-K-Cl cotransporter [candidate division FCPU426 bacterium]
MNKFGTFKGVYLPSILTVLGVIMYLRMGWVLGNVGLLSTIVIVSISSLITFLTALSISAIATNMEVKGGGAYYMISRSFGAEAGAAVGLPLFLAQVIGIGFYITGFIESLSLLLPQISPLALSLGTLVILTFFAYISADLALRAQLFIFVLIILSLLSFFLGRPPADGFAPVPVLGHPLTFWPVFAVFFPAVTGILSGVSMSGDLRHPRKSIPTGTMAAVISGYLIYLAIPVFLHFHVPSDVLRSDMMIVSHLARVPELILLGIWGATLSSALASLLGAPRTLQALAQDRIVPAILGKSFGHASNPRLATAFSFAIAALVLILGELDTIAPVLTMFLLAAYGMLNLIAAVEAFMNNPSWRPVFRMHWSVPFVSFLLCLAVMLMINPGATLIAAVIITLLFTFTVNRRLNRRWEDMRHGLFLALARFSIYRLSNFLPNVKSWRPNILVLSGAPTQRWYLIQLADAITHGKGFLTVATVIKGEDPEGEKQQAMEASLNEFLANRKVPALVEITHGESFFSGARELIRTYGMGPLIPNTVLLGITEKEEHFSEYAELILYIHRRKRNVILFREQDDVRFLPFYRKIICWWRGKESNAGLMLAASYLLQTSPEWRGAELSIKTIVDSEEAAQPVRTFLSQFLANSRIIAHPDVIIKPSERTDAVARIIHERSRDAALIFLGLRPPAPEETAQEYAAYYSSLLTRLKGLPPTVLLLAGEDLNFKEIFS